MSLEAANRMVEASWGIDTASRRIMMAVQGMIECEMMVADNKMREIRGESPAYDGDDFARLSNSLKEQDRSL